MLLAHWSLNGSHNGTAQCKKGDEQKRQKLAAEEARAVTSTQFRAYLGGYTPHGPVPEGVTGPDCTATDREALMSKSGRKMVEHLG